jgi:hypothetical protein
VNCRNCGAVLTLDDMTRPNCPYCRQVLTHHAQAAEHAALVNRIMDDRIRAQYPGTPPDKIPQIGYGYGAPMHNLYEFQQHQMGQAFKRAGWITAVAILVPLVMMLVVGVVVALAMLR